MKKIEISPKAHEDLKGLMEYIESEFDQEVAKRVLREIYEDIESIGIFPKIGNNILGKYSILSDYLCLVSHGNYIFYREDIDSIKIIRIIDERRDFIRILYDEED